jgi:hypothetical protein
MTAFPDMMVKMDEVSQDGMPRHFAESKGHFAAPLVRGSKACTERDEAVSFAPSHAAESPTGHSGGVSP